MSEFEIGFDELQELFDEAESLLEQATSFAHIGKFHSYTTAHIWDETNGMQEVDSKTWKAHQGFKFLNLHVCIDTQEFNPNNEKGYDRRVQVKAAPWNKKLEDGTYERIPSDWFATWEPSVKEVFGSEYKDMTQALKELEGKYAKVLDVPQQPNKRHPEPEYNTAKLVTVYESREAALQDYKSVTGKDAGKVAETVTSNKEPPTKAYKTWDEFAEMVNMLRSDGTTDIKELARLAGVTVANVEEV